MKKIFATLIFCFFLFTISVLSQEARKVDEFGFTNCEILRLNIDILLTELKDSKDAKVYIFVYEGRMLIPMNNEKSKIVYPRFGEAKAQIKNINDHIKFRGFDKNRIVIIYGGFRENYTTEHWIVPANATLPKPSPALTKMKYRKGRAKYSCFF